MTNNIKKIDRTTKTIIVTKQFLINASQIGTPEFDLYLELMEKHPGFTFKEYKITRNPDKTVYGKLTYEVMENFIINRETNEDIRKVILDEFKIVRKISLTQKASYAYVKKWFLGRYKEDFKRYQAEMEAREKVKKAERLLYVEDTQTA